MFLMDAVLSCHKFGPAAIKLINYCRLYLNVILLLDITRPNGRHLDRAAYEGNSTNLLSTRPGHSINQGKPNDKAWMEWRKFLHTLIHRDADLTLKEPMGDWIVEPSTCT